MKILVFMSLVFALLFTASCSKNKDKSEITVEQAIQIAVKNATEKKFDTKNADIEVLKVKNGVEKGPLRILSIIRFFPGEKRKIIIDNEYWIIFFYPKGTLEKPDSLGGDFTVLIDLHSGKILASYAGM